MDFGKCCHCRGKRSWPWSQNGLVGGPSPRAGFGPCGYETPAWESEPPPPSSGSLGAGAGGSLFALLCRSSLWGRKRHLAVGRLPGHISIFRVSPTPCSLPSSHMSLCSCVSGRNNSCFGQRVLEAAHVLIPGVPGGGGHLRQRHPVDPPAGGEP